MATTVMPEAGTAAPDFSGKTQDGSTVTLSDHRGKKVALYFYPKDDTPGCTKQACSLRDDYSRLQDAGIVVIGVSADDVESHQAFAEKYSLPFPLIADTPVPAARNLEREIYSARSRLHDAVRRTLSY